MMQEIIKIIEILLESESGRTIIDKKYLTERSHISDTAIARALEWDYIVGNESGYFVNPSAYLLYQGHKINELTKSLSELIKTSGEESTKINLEMLKHTKTMTWLTKIILVITVLNIGLFVIGLIN